MKHAHLENQSNKTKPESKAPNYQYKRCASKLQEMMNMPLIYSCCELEKQILILN